MYNFPCCTISNTIDFIAKAFEHKLWIKCIAEFLTDVKFYKKTEDADVDETMEKPKQIKINVSEKVM